MASAAVFVGIDVSKARLDVCLWPDGEWLEFANDRKGIHALVRLLTRLGPAAIGLEASGGSERDALAALQAAGLPAHRLNALRSVALPKAAGSWPRTTGSMQASSPASSPAFRNARLSMIRLRREWQSW